ncbi:MAG: hypothetical protein ACLT8O_01830 [Blautia massiliensis (ex Durand et al. 2017)]
MDKMMELSCKHDEKSACRQCEHGIYLYHGECPRKRRKRDMIRKGCIKLYEICEELNVSCKRVTWDTDASGTWMEHYKGVDDWILQKRKKDTGRRHKMFGQIKGKLEFFSVSFLSG